MARATGKRRKAKTKFRWNIWLTVLILFLCALGLGIGLMSIKSEKTKMYDEIIGAQTSVGISNVLDEKNVYAKISYSSLKKKIKNDSYTYVYYGSTDVTEYLEQIQAVNKCAQDNDVSRVYLYSSKWAEGIDVEDEDNGEDNRAKLETKAEAIGGVDLKTYPQLWVYKNGELVFDSNEYMADSNWTYVITQAFGNPERKPAI